MKVIIIGGVAGGASAAARLRRLDEYAEIIILERGEYISYANCGLPYYIGGEIENESSLTLQTPQSFFSRFNIDVRCEHTALKISTESKSVTILNNKSGEEYVECYDKLILSPGAEPVKPNWSAIDSPKLFTLRNIPDTLNIKGHIQNSSAKSAAVIGGGFIGIEMAENLVAAGLHVTLIEASDHIIAPLDYDMACDAHHYLRSKGVALRLCSPVSDLIEKNGGIEIVLQNGEAVSADMVLLSIGVKPESTLAKQAGLSVNSKGAIIVSNRMQTSNKNIYAVGDAIEIKNLITGDAGYMPLAGPANKQGRIAADNICGIESAYAGTQGSAVAKVFDMTIACTGLNEAALSAAEYSYDKVYTFSASHATYYPGAKNMSAKLLFEKESGRILGAQLVGFDGVDKRCDVLATAIRAGLTVEDLTILELCYAPPFSSAKDPVNMLGFAAQNVMQGLVKQFYWNEVSSLQQKSGITLLDVRTEKEYARGHITGTVNIPLDSLRGRLPELNSEKPIYVNCQSGLRSYIACRILAQNGFNCHNLAGGYRLYESATREVGFDGELKQPCGVRV